MRASVKGKLILFSVLLALFLLFVAGKYLILDKQNQEGQLKILSSPSSSIFLNNIATGKNTPFEEKIKVGEYLIKLIPQGEATSTASWQGKVKIYKNALTYVNRELGSSDVTSSGEIFTATKMQSSPKDPATGEIAVETDPTGAIVYLDNDEKGVAPLILSEVPSGTHELSVFLPGFFRRNQKVNVDAKYRVNALFKLAIDQSQKQTTEKQATQSATTTKSTFSVEIKETPTGFLRVREEPTTSASEEAQVKPGEKYTVLEEKSGWYRIEYKEGSEGWISAEYAERID